MWSAIASVLLGLVGWFAARFFGTPFLDFHNLRTQVHEEVIFTANLNPIAAETPRYDKAYDNAAESLRRLGAKVQATNVTATRPLRWFLSKQGYDLVDAGKNLIGLSNSLAMPDRAHHIDKIQAALKLPREYETDYLNELRRQKLQRVADERQSEDPAEARKRMLKQLAERLDEHHAFVKGQFVAWKPGLKNRKFPDYGEPAIVTAVMSAPVYDPDEASSASPYLQEPLSIVVGVHWDDEFLEFRIDGRRFEPIDG